jgi:uncharacterized delta-60 repeat protein
MHKTIILIIAILFLYTGVVLATPGNLDSTFNSPHGFVTYDSGGRDGAEGIAIQSDGKIIVAGHLFPSDTVFLLRYNTDGTLDSTFGSGGVTTYSGGRFALTVAVQDDGKIVVGGRDSSDDLLLLRYNSNGTLDNTFGSSGVVTYDMGHWDSQARAIAIQADGKIVVGGESCCFSTFLILRYNSNGTLDNTFGSGGKVDYLEASSDFGDLAIQSDGKIIVTGINTGEITTSSVIVVRLNSDGTLDSSFGTGGQVIYDGGLTEFGKGVVLQNDGKIIIAGFSMDISRESFDLYEVLLLRYNNDGTLDDSFGTGGIAIHDLTPFNDYALSVNIDITGRIIVFGQSGNNLFITRFDNNGTLDATFGTGGVVSYGFGVNTWGGQDGLALQADGKIVIAGSFSGIDDAVLILRLLSDTPDTPPICGDGYLDSSEQCDDGNTINGDGCSSTCQIEGSISVAVLPTSKQSFFYPAISTRVMNMYPSIAKPVGVGSVAHGGDSIDINIGLYQFSEMMDIYGAYSISTDPKTVNILNPNGSSFTSFTISEILNALLTGVPPVGFQAWKANAEGPIDINPLGTIPVSTLSSGTYTVYLLVTPAGSLSSYYLWITSFKVP